MQEDDVRAVLSDDYTSVAEQETTDIYLLPPNEDPETCTSWLRMRNRNGRYTLMFEETVCDGDVMISPRIKFEVGVRILGGLMALGYEVGAIMKRRSRSYRDEMLEVKIDWIEGLDKSFTQIQGKVRAAVEEAGTKLGLEETYVPHSYIEQVQLEEMTEELRNMTEEMKDKFVMAANRSSMDIPHLERSNSGFGLGSIRSRQERAAKQESVTRLQDAVRKRRSERGNGHGNGDQWGSQDQVFADAAAVLNSPTPPSSVGRRRPPIATPKTQDRGERLPFNGGDSVSNGAGGDGGDESNEHSGGSDRDAPGWVRLRRLGARDVAVAVPTGGCRRRRRGVRAPARGGARVARAHALAARGRHGAGAPAKRVRDGIAVEGRSGRGAAAGAGGDDQLADAVADDAHREDRRARELREDERVGGEDEDVPRGGGRRVGGDAGFAAVRLAAVNQEVREG